MNHGESRNESKSAVMVAAMIHVEVYRTTFSHDSQLAFFKDIRR
jgi:hypothetical protein